MPDTTNNFGRRMRVFSPTAHALQRAAVVCLLSLAFFLAMLVMFAIRGSSIYLLLSAAFLTVHLFTLAGWLTQQRSTVIVYEDGLSFRRRSLNWAEIKSVERRPDASLLITDRGGKKLKLPGAIDSRSDLTNIIETRQSAAAATRSGAPAADTVV